MTQSERLLLAHVGDVDHVGDVAHDGQQVLLLARFQQVLQLEADIEVIFDGGLAPAGHDDDVLDAGVNRLLDAVLNDRLIHDGQHFFRLRLGGGQKARPEACGGENGFADFSQHKLPVWCSRARLATDELCFPVRCVMYWYLGKNANGLRNR